MKFIIVRDEDGATAYAQKRTDGPEIPMADSYSLAGRPSSARSVQEFYELVKAAGEALGAPVEERDGERAHRLPAVDETLEDEDEKAE